jgi:hypothetical protein
MIMKKLILFLLILCNCLICNAGGISKEVLTANTWKVVYPDFHGNKIHIIKVYKDNTLEIKVTYVTLNEMVSALYRYYLTDQKPTKFDIEKVGEADSGRYLVFANMEELNDKDCFFVCFEVISEDKNAVEFRDRFGQFWRLEKQ